MKYTGRALSSQCLFIIKFQKIAVSLICLKKINFLQDIFKNIFLDFGGYFFEKNTIVYPNIYDAHHDKEFWGDPKVFRPERFLDPTGTQVVPKEALMPFSTGFNFSNIAIFLPMILNVCRTGKRICLGETLARESLFYFLCGLLQNFSFELDRSSASVDTDIPKPNFVSTPHDFKVIMSSRQK